MTPHKRKRVTRAAALELLQKYLEDIKPNSMGFFWEPKGEWIYAHGDGKASTDGQFRTQTMTTSATPPVYRVKAVRGAELVFQFEMETEDQKAPNFQGQ